MLKLDWSNRNDGRLRPTLFDLEREVLKQRLRTFKALKKLHQEHPHYKLSIPWGQSFIDLDQVHGIGQDSVFPSTLTEREMLSTRLELFKNALIDWKLFVGVRSELAYSSFGGIYFVSGAELRREVKRLRGYEDTVQTRENMYRFVTGGVWIFKLKTCV